MPFGIVLALFVVALALVISACGSSPPDIEVVLKPNYEPTPTPTRVPLLVTGTARATGEKVDDCASSPEIDDLGFLRTPDDCYETLDAQQMGSYPTLADFVDSPEAQTLAVAVRDRAIVQTGCAPAADRTERSRDVEMALGAIPEVPLREAFRGVFASISQADAACPNDQATWTAQSVDVANRLFETVALLAPDSPKPEPLLTDCCAENITVLTSRLSAANDQIYGIVTARPDKEATEFWSSYAHYHHVRQMRQYAVEERAISTIFLGSSVVARGVFAGDIAGSYNLGIEGRHQPSAHLLATTAQSLHSSVDTIVWGQQTSELFNCIDLVLARFDRLTTARANAFVHVPWLDGIDVDDLLLGSDRAAPTYGNSNLDAVASSVYGTIENGDLTPPGEGPVPDAVAARLEAAREWWTAGKQPCQDRIDLVLTPAASWEAAGKRVVLVFWPLSETIRSLHPEGIGIHERLIDNVREQAESQGIEVLDLSDLLPDDDFVDLTHIDKSGQGDITRTLGEYLAVAET